MNFDITANLALGSDHQAASVALGRFLHGLSHYLLEPPAAVLDLSPGAPAAAPEGGA